MGYTGPAVDSEDFESGEERLIENNRVDGMVLVLWYTMKEAKFLNVREGEEGEFYERIIHVKDEFVLQYELPIRAD